MHSKQSSVLVSHIQDKINKSTSTFGTSGILLSSNWILTHGSLLSPNFFDDDESHDIRDFLMDHQNKLENNFIVVPKNVAETMRFRVQYNIKVDEDDESNRSARLIEEKNCTLRIVWRCPLLRKTFNDLLFSWNFDKISKFDKSLLPIFLLLRINDKMDVVKDEAAEVKRLLSDFYAAHYISNESSYKPRRGKIVEIVSAPFGNAVFLDSVTRGIVSNLFGKNNCIMLTDANAVPGCEGAPVFVVNESDNNRKICGLVIAALSWCRGEWVDYTFVANLQVCLSKILNLTSVNIGLINDDLFLSDTLDRSVVVVKCGSGWGTGAVVNIPNGIIVTCSHVVREAPGSRINLVLNEQVQAWARLVYRTRDGQPYDIAVLKLEQPNYELKALKLDDQSTVKGRSVLTIGYPFFSSPPASYSRGIISRLTRCMLQTTCCVQSGTSGGPIIDVNTGKMLGLIVSNAISSNDNGALYPRFNMAIPSTVIKKPLMDYVETGNVKCLESLSSDDPIVQETWNFYLTPRSKI